MSSSSSTNPQQQPPAITEQAYTVHSGHASVGPVIAVLAVIIILGVISGMIGRLCSGRSIMGYGQFDFEGWIERKCSSCIDGRIESPTPPSAPPRTADSVNVSSGTGGVPVEEKKSEQPEQSHQQHGDMRAYLEIDGILS
ncbi:hypothetical protein RJ641_019351 [Dillenia turbinata]|uniref:Transmembrane protein n=1 Tax=Dillenia turbinata TaxID=194707 RepID=A0AAN8UJ13_9MAGN